MKQYEVSQGGKKISMLTFNFQLNQLLMLINNPILFPHLYEVGKYAAYMGHRKICYIGVSGKDEAVGIYRKDGVINGLRDNGVSLSLIHI